MAGLRFKNIKKVYDGGFTAVEDFNLEIEDKEFIVFVGPSGCGKSTTLRMVAGLEEISGGELYIGDELVNDVEPKDRDIAMVFQNYALYPQMTVRENMSYALRLKKTPKDEIDKKVNEASSMLGLEELLDRKPRALSGGQRQRVALGRAIVRNPKVFLMDEPLSNLDAKLRVETRAQISELHEKLGTTFIYVTHDQTEAMTMGDRIVIMEKGDIKQVDTPENVYFHPANVFVAGFIGSPEMNLFDGVINKDSKGYSIKALGTNMKLCDKIGDRIEEKGYIGKNLVLGIRPEHLYGEKKNYETSFKTTIEFVEMLGSELYVYTQIDGKKILSKLLYTSNAEKGQEIELFADTDEMHFFDKETELNIFA